MLNLTTQNCPFKNSSFNENAYGIFFKVVFIQLINYLKGSVQSSFLRSFKSISVCFSVLITLRSVGTVFGDLLKNTLKQTMKVSHCC